MKPRALIVRQLLFIAVDALMVGAAFRLAYILRFHSGWIPLVHDVPPLAWYTQAVAIVLIVYVLFFRGAGMYAMDRVRTLQISTWAIIHGATLAGVTLMAISFLYRDASYSRLVVALAWGFVIVLVRAGRWALARALARSQPSSRVLIIGAGPMADQLAARMRGQGGYQVVGAIRADQAPAASPAPRLPIVGTWHDLPSWIGRHTVDEVILTEPLLPRAQVIALINQCEQAFVQFRMVPDTLELLTTERGTDQLDGIPLLGLKQSPLVNPWNRLLKRTMDIALAAGGILATAPAWAAIAWVIRRDSPGPVFYRQERVGEDGRVFRILKFRTMRVGAEDATGPVWATPDDARRTRAGAWLRRHNLDELPQLINVLRGDMSLVGPRPERPHFVRQFTRDIPRYMARHRIRSGITGWAQIHGLRGDTSIDTRTQHDLYYVEHWSLGLDVYILWKSLTAVRNAY